MTTCQNRLEITLDKRGGKQCVKGARIAVYDDIPGALANGMASTEVLDDFPELTREDVHARLKYGARRDRHLLVDLQK